MQEGNRDPLTVYGAIPLDRVDVRAGACMSIDLRAETGCPYAVQDETAKVHPPHPFALSVIAPVEGELPIGEIRFWLVDKEVRMVGQLTGREEVFEVTPDLLTAARDDRGYLQRLRDWLGLAAA